MRRRVLPTLLIGLLLLVAAANAARTAEPERDRYPLWYPPLAVLRSSSAHDLADLGRFPAVFFARTAAYNDWNQIPLLGTVDGRTLLAALAAEEATDLQYLLLPPASSPGAVLRARVPGLTSREAREAFLERAGAADPARVPCRTVDGELVIASNERLLETFTGSAEGRAPLPGAAWPAMLDAALHAPARTLTGWIHLRWALDVAGTLTGFSLSERLLLGGVDVPPALVFSAVTREDTLDLQLGVPLSPDRATQGAAAAAVPLGPLAAALPDAAELAVHLHLDSLRATAEDRPLWEALIALLNVPLPETAYNIEQTTRGFRLLTGLHPQHSLLDGLGTGLALGLWTGPDGTSDWVVVADVTDAARIEQTLRRGLAWGRFFAEEHGARFQVRDLASQQVCFAREIAVGETRFAVRLGARHLLVARRTPTLAAVQERLTGTAAAAPPAPAGLAWRLRLSDATAGHLDSGALSALMALVLHTETGRLHVDAEEIALTARGPTAPLSLALLGGALGRHLEGALLPDPADNAEAWLRLFLAAQQTFRHLSLGTLTETGPGFAPRLTDLVRTERLERFYNRLYDFSDQGFTFAQVARAGRIAGYTLRIAQSRGGTPLDGSAEWILLAEPHDPHACPALLIDQDGRVLARRLSPAHTPSLADLPADLTEAGWRKR